MMIGLPSFERIEEEHEDVQTVSNLDRRDR